MTRVALLAAITLCVGAPSWAQQPLPRPLVDAMAGIFALREFTVFDWIGGSYDRGTLTLDGYARTPGLKKRAEDTARKTSGIDEVVNTIQVLPALSFDDDIRIRAYAAIYTSSALERYGQRPGTTRALLTDLADAQRLGLDAVSIGTGPHAIPIAVSGARITLLGEVRTSGDRQVAEVALRSVSGVLGVTNQLRVAGQR